MGEIWRSLTREQQRMVALAGGGVALTLIVYLVTSAIVALVVAAIVAYSLGRYRPNHRLEPAAPAPEPVTKVEPPSHPAAQARVKPAPQTPLGRLFAERPGWSGPPVGAYEPPPRRRRPERAEEEQLTIPLQDPYDSA